MPVDWTITIEGKNEFGGVCRKTVRIDKSWERLFDGDIGLSIEGGKTIITALQSAVVAREAETYSHFRTGLLRLPHVQADQGLHITPDPNRLWHGKGP